MIWDCFLILNELDILDLRLNVHSQFVDRFVLVESTHTFRGNPKPLFFHENRNRFDPFLDRITHVVFDKCDSWKSRNPWKNVQEQRNAIHRGLAGISDDDTMFLCDVDQLIDFNKCPVSKGQYLEIQMRVFHYYLNLLFLGPVDRAEAFTVERLKDNQGDMLFVNTKGAIRVENGGWHFTYQGGPERVKYKIQAQAHSEFDRPDVTEGLKDRIDQGADVLRRADPFSVKKIPITEATHPKFLVENQDRYRDLILA